MAEDKADTTPDNADKGEGPRTIPLPNTHTAQGNEDFWINFNQWAAIKAKPKRYIIDRRKVESTKYSKAGPMSPADWERFGLWVSEKGKPKFYQAPDPIKRNKAPLNQLMRRIRELARPRRITPRFVMKSRRGRRGRFGKVSVKRLNQLSMPKRCCGMLCKKPPPVFKMKIARAALNYVATPRIVQLSKPVSSPRPQHCILSRREEVWPRQKMTNRQMLLHLIRLEYLSAPTKRTNRVDDEEPCTKVPLSQLMPRIEVLAQPKPTFEHKSARGPRKPLSALQGRVDQLAKPRKYKENKSNPFEVKRGALKATPSARIIELAQPKPDFSIN